MRARYAIVGLCVLFVVVTASSGPAGAAPLGNPIGGVSPTGSGSWDAPYVYDYGGGVCAMGADTATGAGQHVQFVNMSGFTSAAPGGVIDTKGSHGGVGAASGINLVSTGAIVCAGYLDGSATSYNTYASPISITAGTTIDVQGSLSGYSVMSDHHNHYGAENTSLYAPGAVTLAGGIDAGQHTNTRPRDGGTVTIQGSSGGGKAGTVSIGGSILTHGIDVDGSGSGNGGGVTINSSGDVTVSGDILNWGSRSGTNALVSITADGAAAVTGYIDSHAQSYQGNAGAVTISGSSASIDGTDVSGYSVWASVNRTSTETGGTVMLTATAGDVDVAGGFNLGTGVGGAKTNRGDLSISASGSSILGALDLNLIDQVTFDVGSVVTIDGELKGLTVDDLNKEVSGFFSINSDIYYDDDASAELSGAYDILIGGSDSGYDLNPLGAGGLIAEPAALGLIGLASLLVRRRRT